MSSFNRRFVLLGAAALAGCGFAPAYGPNGSARHLLNAVSVDEIKSSNGFHLVRQLEHRLGRPNAPSYGLSVSIVTQQQGVAVTTDNRTTRREIFGSATYALRRLDDQTVVGSAKVSSFTGYSTTGSTVSELSAEQDAYERLMIILADQIVSDLIAKSGNVPG